ncbi:MAG TPA: putative lipid II flippase FtsW [Dehalococcoidia bacterium]|jgi:cell division protein FtsW|nr:putative lipid II flippase FtsW [Dehalococcoidia bacterium]
MAVTAHPSRLRIGSPDYLIMLTVGVLVVLGVITVYSSSFALGILEFGDANYFVFRQVLFGVLGAGVMIALMKTDYRQLRVISPLLMLAAIFGLVAVLLPGIGLERNGATRWIAVGGPVPPLQPSEFAKLALIIYVSAWLAGRGEHVKAFWTGFFPFVVLVGLVAGLVMLEPDLGTTIVIVLTTMTLVFVAGASLTHVFAFAGIGSVVASLLILTGEYRADRLFAFISAEDDPGGRGFQTLQLLIALGSGGIHGLGLGASRQKFFYVPGAHTDGIFAIIGEELGFIGCAAVIVLFAVLLIRGFRVILRARDDFGSLLAVGIVSWIGYQALINIGGITRTLPLTGIPLPFVSYGGSALLAMLAAVGILLSVSRYGVDEKSLAPRTKPADGSDAIVRPTRKTTNRLRNKGGGAWPQRKGAQ